MSFVPAKRKDVKYALLGPNKFLDKKVYGVPWYQERVIERLRRQESALARKNKNKLPVSKGADSSRWIFIKDGLDDFRDGLPPEVPDIFIRRKDNFPMVKPDHRKLLKSLKQPAVRQRFSKDEVCFSRALPLVRRRRESVADVEDGLMAHRLALFPHLMEAVPQDILEDVVGILDPEAAACIEVEEDDEAEDSSRNRSATGISEEGEYSTPGDAVTPLNGLTVAKGGRQETSATSTAESAFSPLTVPEKTATPSTSSGTDRIPSSKNPYRWMYNRTVGNTGMSPRIDGSLASQRSLNEACVAPPVTIDKFRPIVEGGDGRGGSNNGALEGDGERHVSNVTKTFCDWVRGLGGEETNNIEESTILSLFAAGYETKPSLLVPIKVVELQNIPNELRVAAGVPPPPPPPKLTALPGQRPPIDPGNIKTISDVEILKEDERRLASRANPDFGKFTYGAWYLPKKFWVKRDAENALEDPRETERRQESSTVRKNAAIEEQLAVLSGSRSFIDFLQKKPRKPEFMQRVEGIIERIKLDGESGSVLSSGTGVPPVSNPPN